MKLQPEVVAKPFGPFTFNCLSPVIIYQRNAQCKTCLEELIQGSNRMLRRKATWP